ncbi:threonine ammonia-lyase [Ectobacillus polymachus]|uniref:threonine ammonia-lyase n=1 Tax=Ectobacillus polymachus TaxID=1508806 RepID=UPI003A872D20
MLSRKELLQAREGMKGIVHTTPIDYSKTFSKLSGNDVYIKLENLQKTGSFKVRGSYNKLMSIPKEQLQAGIVAASAGNHAQGVAYSSGMLDVPCTIVMPKGASLSKIQATRQYGAEVILYGNSVDEALSYAKELQNKNGAVFIHPFDDEAIIAGQGTLGLEIIEQMQDVEAVICPVGGGGLIAGVSLAIKEYNPKIKVYGVQARACPSMKQSLLENKVVSVNLSPTMADGIAVKRPGDLTFQMIRRYVDDIVCVDEMEIARSMLLLLERNKLLVEGAGASSLATLLYHKTPLARKKVVAILSGGNVDVNFISRVIEHGMAEAGRFVQFTTLIRDKPGELEKILQIISLMEANVLQINHQRMGKHVFPGYAQLQISLETKDPKHIKNIMDKLESEGLTTTFIQ